MCSASSMHLCGFEFFRCFLSSFSCMLWILILSHIWQLVLVPKFRVCVLVKSNPVCFKFAFWKGFLQIFRPAKANTCPCSTAYSSLVSLGYEKLVSNDYRLPPTKLEFILHTLVICLDPSMIYDANISRMIRLFLCVLPQASTRITLPPILVSPSFYLSGPTVLHLTYFKFPSPSKWQ
jgi:hypothetical protein